LLHLTYFCPLMNCKNWISGFFSTSDDDIQWNFDISRCFWSSQTKFEFHCAWPTPLTKLYPLMTQFFILSPQWMKIFNWSCICGFILDS
jgi:hypothetical protein